MMKLFFTVSWLILMMNVIAQRPAQGPMSQKKYSPEKLGYKLAWQDEFNGNALDTTKWKVRGVGERAIAYVSEEAVKVEDGYLKLYALQKGDSLLGSAIGTQGLFMSKYGYYECRAKLQRSPGVWGAFWIQSPDISKGEDPAVYGAEIDIMEFFKK
ncbi:MAG: glycoside hydrolase family 16 protein, partial [Bacteroidetes bacterium]|nr:glycoside hydrolase family 16 protein [Bacteroidota bacterium]